MENKGHALSQLHYEAKLYGMHILDHLRKVREVQFGRQKPKEEFTTHLVYTKDEPGEWKYESTPTTYGPQRITLRFNESW